MANRLTVKTVALPARAICANGERVRVRGGRALKCPQLSGLACPRARRVGQSQHFPAILCHPRTCSEDPSIGWLRRKKMISRQAASTTRTHHQHLQQTATKKRGEERRGKRAGLPAFIREHLRRRSIVRVVLPAQRPAWGRYVHNDLAECSVGPRCPLRSALTSVPTFKTPRESAPLKRTPPK